MTFPDLSTLLTRGRDAGGLASGFSSLFGEARRPAIWPLSTPRSRSEEWLASLTEGINGLTPRRRSDALEELTQALAAYAPRRSRRPAIGALLLLAGIGIAAAALARRG